MLCTLSQVTSSTDRQVLLAGVEKILIECSNKTFSSDEERASFYNKWVLVYENHFPDLFWIETDDKSPLHVVGYLTGCADSQKATPWINPNIRYYELFADQFEQFPGHLHINVAPGNQGKGIGRRLIDAFALELRQRKAAGMHLITSPSANNVQFYRALDFRSEIERKYLEIPLLFMGRSL